MFQRRSTPLLLVRAHNKKIQKIYTDLIFFLSVSESDQVEMAGTGVSELAGSLAILLLLCVTSRPGLAATEDISRVSETGAVYRQCWAGSGIFGHCGSGSRVLVTKNWKKLHLKKKQYFWGSNIAIYLS